MYWYIVHDQRDDYVYITNEYPDDLRPFEYITGIYPQ